MFARLQEIAPKSEKQARWSCIRNEEQNRLVILACGDFYWLVSPY